jgi:hypothetical protein
MSLRLVLLALTLVIAGCRTAYYIHEVRDAAIVSNVASTSKEEVRKAIIRAGTTLGWQMRDNGGDALVATLQLRSHTAVVDIPYSAKAYSILYKDSTNLKYTGTSIHSNYNGWIQNLHRAINVQVGLL